MVFHCLFVPLDDNYDWKGNFMKLLQGRRDAGLLQHHEAITGTAKNHVAQDYLDRLSRAVANSKRVRYSVVIRF